MINSGFLEMNLETEIDRGLWQAIRRSYESQAWSNAILDAIHFLSDAIRSKTGLQSDGTSLAGQAFGGKQPKLQLNRLQTDSEKNVQAGVEQMLRGLYQAVRNPRSHERLSDSQKDADALIVFIDYVLRVIGHAKASFSIDEFVGRVVEDNFAPNKRYATLLVGEIPARQRIQVALAVYQRKLEAKGQNLRYFFDALFPELSTEEQVELLQAISEELRTNSDEAALRALLQLLDTDQWSRIEEGSRLRTENRLIVNLKQAQYQKRTDKCLAGGLATWSRRFWPHFALKNELINGITEMLDSTNDLSIDYVFKFCFWNLKGAVGPQPSYALKRIFADKLKNGDVRFKEALDWMSPWPSEKWGEQVQEALKAFEAAQPTSPSGDLDDDIPF